MTENSRHFLKIFVQFVFIFLLSFPITVHASEVIKDFESTVVVNQDASITVTEKIQAVCLGHNIKHGIYRDIPYKYHTSSGYQTDTHLKVLDVKIDGRRADFHQVVRTPFVRIYMGNKKIFLPHGMHSFEITYTMKRMVGFFDKYDELYWNVTGNQWAFPIERASVVIILPKDTRFMQFATYTGRLGSKKTMARVTDKGPRSIAFETTAPLNPGEGFTVAAAWPPGIIERPTDVEKILYFLWDNISLAVGLIGTCITFLYFFITWKKVGKDPEKGTVVPIFEPPKAFGPAAARYIMKMGFDDKVFSAAVISLAVKGYLTIKDEHGKYTLIRRRDGAKGELSEGEKSLFAKLFSRYDEVSLDSSNASTIQSALKALQKNLTAHFERIYFYSNRKQLIPGLVLSLLTLFGMALGSEDIFGAAFMSVWLSGWSGFSAFLALSAYNALKSAFAAKQFGSFKQALKPTLFALPFTFFWFVGCLFYAKLAGFSSLVVFIALISINIFFYQIMKAPTMHGRKMMDILEGFQMFLETAEKYRLKTLTAPGKLPELFEKYLPWAVALDVENQWTEKFNNYLKDATTPETERAYSPTWYVGSFHTPTALTSSLGSGISSAVASASVSGSGSGSSGGGFSGGGGGGGGGGGW